jgi:hypothetical protein
VLFVARVELNLAVPRWGVSFAADQVLAQPSGTAPK